MRVKNLAPDSDVVIVETIEGNVTVSRDENGTVRIVLTNNFSSKDQEDDTYILGQVH